MIFIVVTTPQPGSCRLALSSNVPSSFILSDMLLASGKAPNMPFLWAPAATPTPRRRRPRPAGRARRAAQSKATAPRSRHSRTRASPSDRPVTRSVSKGSTMFLRRSSTGSSRSAAATRSMWISVAAAISGAPQPRAAPPTGVFVSTARLRCR